MLEFTSLPPTSLIHQPLLDVEKAEDLTSEVKKLSEKGATCPAMSDLGMGFISPIFVVSKPGRAWCPIINLKILTTTYTLLTSIWRQ